MRYNNKVYKFDPRLLLLDNTLASPATGAISTSSCPVVPKSFLNKHSCRMEPTCAPRSFSSANIELTDQTLAQYYSLSHKYVYRISGIRLAYNDSPCNGISRWRYLGASCNDPTDLNPSTKNTLENLLRSSTDTNPYVRDIEVTSSSGTCTDSAANGAQLQVELSCWEHSHADYYSVYDFSSWANDHNGTDSLAQYFLLLLNYL
jgi:hypothetical protein